jgi:hypothetical protein
MAVIVSVGLLTLAALLFISPLVIRSQKGTYVLFLSQARQVGIALQYHHSRHGAWPSTLQAIDPNFAVPPEVLTYPSISNLPIDMRDLPDEYPTEQWLYFPPKSEDSSQIILAAPLPLIRSKDKMERIIVRADTTTSVVDELSFGRTIEKQFAESGPGE